MIQKAIDRYLNNKVQTIQFNSDGKIIASDDILFPVNKEETIYAINPFFDFFQEIITEKKRREVFKMILLEINKKNLVVDILVYSGSIKTKPYMLIFDKSSFYKEIQQITQEKNELFISNFNENQKNLELNNEKKFKNKFLASISHDLKTPITGVLGLLELFKKENLAYEQKNY